MEKKVTVVIPTFNSEKFIGNCIESIILQDYKNIEIIVSDDCSNDDTVVICKSYSNKIHIIVIEHDFNRGPMFGRADGIIHSTGEFVVFCDSDDYLPQNAISNLVKAYSNLESDMIIGNFAMTYDGTKEIPNFNRLGTGVHNGRDILINQIDDGTLSGMLISSMCGKLYKKSILEKFVNEINTNVRINEDGMFNTMYILKSKRILVIDEITYVVRCWKHVENIIYFQPEGYYDLADKELEKMKNYWPNQNNYELQMKRRHVSEAFWQCNKSARALGFWDSYRYISKSFDELNQTVNYSIMEPKKMRSYKKVLLFLMKNRCKLTFLIICRWIAPKLRAKIAR